MTDAPGLLVVGRVERPHGVAGEVSVSIRTDFPDIDRLPGVVILLVNLVLAHRAAQFQPLQSL